VTGVAWAPTDCGPEVITSSKNMGMTTSHPQRHQRDVMNEPFLDWTTNHNRLPHHTVGSPTRSVGCDPILMHPHTYSIRVLPIGSQRVEAISGSRLDVAVFAITLVVSRDRAGIGGALADRAAVGSSNAPPVLAPDEPSGVLGAVARARVDPTLKDRALQDALRQAVATRRDFRSWIINHAGSVATLHSPEELV
jgi:hypothetical protein